jgi:hypothetical protein
MRSFSLVLLRRLLFRPDAAAPQTPKAARLTLYDRLSSQTLTQIERVLLHSLAHEPQDVVRRKTVDTVADLANQSMRRGRPWHALQAQAFGMAQAEDAPSRDVAFRLFAACPNLVMDLQTDAVLGVLKKGLQDPESIAVSVFSIFLSYCILHRAMSCRPHFQVLRSLAVGMRGFLRRTISAAVYATLWHVARCEIQPVHLDIRLPVVIMWRRRELGVSGSLAPFERLAVPRLSCALDQNAPAPSRPAPAHPDALT